MWTLTHNKALAILYIANKNILQPCARSNGPSERRKKTASSQRLCLIVEAPDSTLPQELPRRRCMLLWSNPDKSVALPQGAHARKAILRSGPMRNLTEEDTSTCSLKAFAQRAHDQSVHKTQSPVWPLSMPNLHRHHGRSVRSSTGTDPAQSRWSTTIIQRRT